MTDANARLIERVMDDPDPPEEAWESLQELNEQVDWDLHNMLPHLVDRDGNLRDRACTGRSDD